MEFFYLFIMAHLIWERFLKTPEYDNTFKMHSCSNNTINTIFYNLKLRFNLLILKRKGH